MPTSDQREQRVNEAIAEYLAGCDAGTPPDRALFLARHADIAGSLREFLDDHERMRQAAPLPPSAGDTATLSPGATATRPCTPPLDTIRYFGDYELLEEIARGGMGVVYRAKQVSLHRVVALKMILAGELASSADVQRFRTEAEASAGLDHPNIVPIYEVGDHAGQHYFTMKLVEGGTLAGWIADQRSKLAELPHALQADIARTIATIARAVHYAHQRGILHRDLKPANVLLAACGLALGQTATPPCANWIPMITDFGLAKRTEGDPGLTRSGAIVGTPSYMAPEQARSEKSLTTAVDTYSLGAILYEMLAGRPPFLAPTHFDTLMQVLDAEPVRPRSLAPEIDRDLETICLKCLQKEPARRYGSAEALADDLDRWLRGDLIKARPSRPWERAIRWLKRRPAIAALALVSVLALVALLASGILFSLRLQEKSDEVAAKVILADEANERAQAYEAAAKKGREEIAQEQKRSAAASRKARQVLSQANVAAGWRHVDIGDYRTALTLFAQALKLEEDDPRRTEVHRVRIGTVLQRFPRLLQVIDEDAGVRRIALSPDGKRLATGTLNFNKQRGSVRVWDLATGKALFAPLDHDGGAAHVEFSTDGKYLLTRTFHWGRSGKRKIWPVKAKARVWHADTGRPVTPWLEHTGSILHAHFSVDGKRLLTASHDADALDSNGVGEFLRSVVAGKATVKVWETATGKLLHTLPIGHNMVFAEFSPDGKQIAVVDDKTIRIYDAQTGGQRHVLRHPSEIRCADLNEWGRLVTGGTDEDKEGSEAVVWDAVKGNRMKLRPMTQLQQVHQVLFSPDGGRFLTRSNKEVRLWNANTGRPLPYVPLKHDDLTLFSSGSKDTGMLPGGSIKQEADIEHASFSPDGRRVLTAGRDGAKVWDATTGQALLPSLRHEDMVWHALFTPDGRGVVTASEDGTVRWWDVAGVQPVLEPLAHDRPIRMAFFFSEEHFYSVSGSANPAKKEKEYLQIWSVRTGKPLGPPLPHEAPIQHVVFRADNHRVFSVTELAGVSRLLAWDARTGAALPSPVKPDPRSRLSMSPDGRHLLEIAAANALTRQAKVWDLSTGRLLGVLEHEGNVLGAGFANDGSFALTISAKDARRQEVSIWDLPARKRRFGPLVVNDGVNQIKTSLDDRRMMIISGKQRMVYSASTGELLAQSVQDEHYLHAAQRAFAERTRTYSNDRALRSFRAWVSDDASGQKLTPSFLHPSWVQNTALSNKLLMNVCEDNTLWLWDVSPDERPVGDLLREAELATGYRIDPTGNLELVKPGEWRQTWKDLRARYPERFATSSAEKARVWHQHQLRASEQEGDTFARLWHLDRLIAAHPKDGNLYFRRGLAYHGNGAGTTMKEALADYSRAIELGLQSAEVFHKRGELRANDENWKEALADYTQALKRGGDRAALLRERGHALVKLEQWKDALVDLDEAIRLVPGNAGAWQDRGLAHGDLHQWKEAIRDHEESLRLAADEFDAWEELATAHAELGQWDLAESRFRTATDRLSPASPAAWEARAWLTLRRGDHDSYRRVCAGLLGRYGRVTDPDQANSVAWTCAIGPPEGMDLSRALLLAELALYRHSEERNHLHTLACVLYRRGRYAEAVRLLTRSVAKHGKSGDVWDHLFLAMAHHRLGHADEARDWLSKANRWLADAEAARKKDPSSPLLSSWTERLGVQVLRQEAEELLKAPGELDGRGSATGRN
jgi:serine/threonine protein kinase/WD40 repeat protein/Flp pilus assembly protein TadD